MKENKNTLVKLLIFICVILVLILAFMCFNNKQNINLNDINAYINDIKLILEKNTNDTFLEDGEWIITNNGVLHKNEKIVNIASSYEKPSSGRILVENGMLKEKEFSMNGYYIYFDENDNLFYKKIERGITITGIQDENNIPIVFDSWYDAYIAFNKKYYKDLNFYSYYSDNIKTDILPNNIIWTVYGEVEFPFSDIKFALSGNYFEDNSYQININNSQKIYEYDIESIFVNAGSNNTKIKILDKMHPNSNMNIDNKNKYLYSYKYFNYEQIDNNIENTADIKASPYIFISGIYFDSDKIIFENIGNLFIDNCSFNGQLSINILEEGLSNIEINNSNFKYENKLDFKGMYDYEKYGIYITGENEKNNLIKLKIYNNKISKYNRGIYIHIENNNIVEIKDNIITKLQDIKRSAIELSKVHEIYIENNYIDVDGNAFSFNKQYLSLITSIKNNQIKSKYFIWNDNDYAPYIIFSNNDLKINNIDKSITSKGKIIENNIDKNIMSENIRSEGCILINGDGTKIGDEVKCGSEEFYIIPRDKTLNTDDNTITLLAKYNLNIGKTINGVIGIQNIKANTLVGKNDIGGLSFSNTNYWSNFNNSTTFVYNSNSNLYNYLQNYKYYLFKIIGKNLKDVTLPSYNQINNMGCMYGLTSNGKGCAQANVPPFIYSSSYYTGTSNGNSGLVVVYSNGSVSHGDYNNSTIGCRPVVIIDKSELFGKK